MNGMPANGPSAPLNAVMVTKQEKLTVPSLNWDKSRLLMKVFAKERSQKPRPTAQTKKNVLEPTSQVLGQNVLRNVEEENRQDSLFA